jgi:serine/threonine-protein kinase HipA
MSAADTLHPADATVLNLFLTNVDAHAKNYVGRKGCEPGPPLRPHVRRRMATECGLNARALVRRIEAMANKAMAEVDAAAEDVRAMPAGDQPMLRNFVAAIRQRCLAVIRNRSEEGTDDAAGDDADQAASPIPDETLSPPAIP